MALATAGEDDASKGGLAVVSAAFRIELLRIMRAKDDPAFVDMQMAMRRTNVQHPVPPELISSLRVTSEDDVREDQRRLFPPIGGMSHVERDFLNREQVMAFARFWDLPVIVWRLTLVEPLPQHCDPMLSQLYEEEPALFGFFCEGAPAQTEQPIRATRGLPNGAKLILDSLSWQNDVEDPAYAAARRAPGGLRKFQVIELTAPPYSVNVRVSGGKWHGIDLPDLSDVAETVVEGEVIVPLLQRSDPIEVDLHTILAVQLGLPRKVMAKFHNFRLSFCLTDYKLQGNTLPFIIISVMPRFVQPYMDLESFYVLISRGTSLAGVRLLAYHKQALEALLEMRHTVELKSWNAGYETTYDPPRPHGHWREDLAAIAATKEKVASKAADVAAAVARKAAADLALKTAPKELKGLTMPQLRSRLVEAGAEPRGTFLKGELIARVMQLQNEAGPMPKPPPEPKHPRKQPTEQPTKPPKKPPAKPPTKPPTKAPTKPPTKPTSKPPGGLVCKEAAQLSRTALEAHFFTSSEFEEIEGDDRGRRFCRHRVETHRGERVWATDLQLRALAADQGVDLAIVDATRLVDGCTFYTANGSAEGASGSIRSWRRQLVPRLLAQRGSSWRAGGNARRLIVFIWLGDSHYEPAMPRASVPPAEEDGARRAAKCAAAVEPPAKRQKDDAGGVSERVDARDDDECAWNPDDPEALMIHGHGGGFSPRSPQPEDTWPRLEAMLAAGLLERHSVPGDGSCAYWSTLIAVGHHDVSPARGRPFFERHPNPLERATAGARVAVKTMLALRDRCVQWCLAPAQRQVCLLEPSLCIQFGQYAAERLRGCSPGLLAQLRAEVGMRPDEYISDTKAIFMLHTCPLLQAAASGTGAGGEQVGDAVADLLSDVLATSNVDSIEISAISGPLASRGISLAAVQHALAVLVTHGSIAIDGGVVRFV